MALSHGVHAGCATLIVELQMLVWQLVWQLVATCALAGSDARALSFIAEWAEMLSLRLRIQEVRAVTGFPWLVFVSCDVHLGFGVQWLFLWPRDTNAVTCATQGSHTEQPAQQTGPPDPLLVLRDERTRQTQEIASAPFPTNVLRCYTYNSCVSEDTSWNIKRNQFLFACSLGLYFVVP